jgi:apolipoprotein N-acyltransferase
VRGLVTRLGAGPRGRDGAALLAGALLPLAFAPFNLYVFSVVSPAILWALWLRASARRALLRGFLFGLGMFGVGVTWIYVSIHTFGGVGVPMTVFITVLFVTVLSLFPAAAGYAARLLSRGGGDGVALLVVFPAAWVTAEWVRGWFLTGFPWLNLGYSQIDGPLAGLAPVAGVYGVSLAVAVSAGLLCYVFIAPRWAPRAAVVVIAAGLWMAGTLLGTVSWTAPVGKPLRVSLLQGDLSQDIKWEADMLGPTIELYERLTRKHWDSDLIIWPETAIPAFLEQVRPEVDALDEETRTHDTELMVGLVVMDAQRHYYNSVMQLGGSSGFYFKHHLVPFTEYLPLKHVLGDLIKIMDVPMSDFSPGAANQTPMRVKGVNVAVSICFEDAFGEEIIRALPRANVLVNVSNDAWFGNSIAPPQHLQIARMRALETGRPLLRDTNTGITAVIAPDGAVTARAPQFQVAALTADIQPMDGATPYSRAGNAPVVVMLSIMWVAGLAWGHRVRRRSGVLPGAE